MIVVDTFSGNKLNQFLAELHALDSSLEVRAFALVTAPEVLRVRVENRSADQFKDIGISLKLNSDVMKHQQPIEQVVDNTALMPEETAEVILEQCVGVLSPLPGLGPSLDAG